MEDHSEDEKLEEEDREKYYYRKNYKVPSN